MTDKDAFFWIASGGHFIDEAIVSAESAKTHMPDVPRFLFSIAEPPRRITSRLVLRSLIHLPTNVLVLVEYMIVACNISSTGLSERDIHGYRHNILESVDELSTAIFL